MSSGKRALIEALESIEAGCAAVSAFPVETLSRTEGRDLLARLDRLDQRLELLRKQLSGRMIAVARARSVWQREPRCEPRSA